MSGGRGRVAALAAAACLASALAGALAARLVASSSPATRESHAAPWSWRLVDPARDVAIGRPSEDFGFGGASDFVINVGGTSTWAGNRLDLTSANGLFELEHGASVPASRLGGSLTVGSAGPDQVPLVVAGVRARALELWDAGGRPVAAVRADGLVLHGIRLAAHVDPAGRVVLEAVLPGGRTQVLLVGRRAQASSR